MAKGKNKDASEISPERQAIIDDMTSRDGDWDIVEGQKNLQMDAGAEITGVIKRTPYEAGKSAAFDIEVDGGETVAYWCPTVLQNLMKKVREGDIVRIRCLGKTLRTDNGTAWDFVLAVRH